MAAKLPVPEKHEYPRILSWALSYLHRRKLTYMNTSLKQHELFGAMYMILIHVARHPGTSQDAIVNHMNIDKCTVARRTKKLVELGYITRETDKADRRQNNLFLTESGEKVIPVIREHLGIWSDEIFACLNDDEKEVLVSLLTKVVENCKDEEK